MAYFLLSMPKEIPPDMDEPEYPGGAISAHRPPSGTFRMQRSESGRRI
jgi:hypothetical protein